MKWISAEERYPRTGRLVMCRLQHWHTLNIREYALIKVNESDCLWHFPEGCEVDHNWNVIAWRKIEKGEVIPSDKDA